MPAPPRRAWPRRARGNASLCLPPSGAPVAALVDVHDNDALDRAHMGAVASARLSLDGVEPAWGGPMWARADVGVDGDGAVGGRRYVQRFDGAGGAPSPVGCDGTLALVGAPHDGCDSGLGRAERCGAVRAYTRTPSGDWSPAAALDGGPGVAATPDAQLGAAVALWSPQGIGGGGDRRRIAALSAPGATPPRVVVYTWASASAPAIHAATLAPQTHSVALAATLRVGAHGSLPDPLPPGHGCGAVPGSLAVTHDGLGGLLVALGCAGLEAVFVFRDAPGGGGAPAATAGPDAARWVQAIILRAAEYAGGHMDGGALFHAAPAAFGAAVVASGPTVAVGAPLWAPAAALSAAGAAPDTHDTAAARAEARGAGAVFVFELLLGVALGDATDGTSWARLAGWPAGDAATRAGAPLRAYDDAVGDGVWVEHAVLVSPPPPLPAAPAGASGTANGWHAFGASLGLDGDALIVGSPRAPPAGGADAPTTWGFETGDLRGWLARGDAFARAPTYGEAARSRPAYGAPPYAPPAARSRHTGRYWVSSFDALYRSPTVGNAPVTGDTPKGSLTSAPFLVAGDSLSLLVGGGCDARSTYVELLVGGARAAVATGGCSDELRRVTWDTRALRGAIAQVRAVDDASAAPWGFIAFDDVRMAWGREAVAALARGGAAAGAAHVYSRVAAPGAGDDAEPLCPRGAPRTGCRWRLEVELRPARRAASRGSAGFGASVAIDEATGIAVVAAAMGEGEAAGSDVGAGEGAAEEDDEEGSGYAGDGDAARARTSPPRVQARATTAMLAARLSAAQGGEANLGVTPRLPLWGAHGL